MNLKEQRYIVTLADCGNMTKAAQLLGVSQPALSSYLAGVENSLGCPLFERTAKGLLPTLLGDIYIAKARKILALGDEFDLERNQVIRGCHGRLRISIPLRRSPALIPAALKVFCAIYPDVEVVLHEGNQRAMTEILNIDGLDIMFCNLMDLQQGLEYVDICQDPIIFLVQQSHPFARHGILKPEFQRPWVDVKEFEQEVFLLQHPGQSLRQYSDRILARSGVKPTRTMYVRNIETAAQIASEGMGVTFCTESYFRRMYFTHRPQAFSVGEKQLCATLYAGYRRGKNLPKYALDFMDIMRVVMSTELAVRMTPYIDKKEKNIENSQAGCGRNA